MSTKRHALIMLALFGTACVVNTQSIQTNQYGSSAWQTAESLSGTLRIRFVPRHVTICQDREMLHVVAGPAGSG